MAASVAARHTRGDGQAAATTCPAPRPRRWMRTPRSGGQRAIEDWPPPTSTPSAVLTSPPVLPQDRVDLHWADPAPGPPRHHRPRPASPRPSRGRYTISATAPLPTHAWRCAAITRPPRTFIPNARLLPGLGPCRSLASGCRRLARAAWL